MQELSKILVLDEEDDTADLFQQAFAEAISSGEYSFTFVKTKEDAEKTLASENFDIFVLDMALLAFDISVV